MRPQHTMATAATLLAYAAQAFGHGAPAYISLNTAENHLCVADGFSVTEFADNGGEVSSDLPGFGVFSPSDGVASGTPLYVEVTQALMYWDGDSVETTPETLYLINPDFDNSYAVHSSSGEQTGLLWGVYSGVLFWERDGLFLFDSVSPAPGLYGVAARVSAPGHGDSKPFLIRMAYDPANAFDGAAREEGFAALEALVEVPASADFDGDGDTDLSDLMALQRGFGLATLTVTHGDGNADRDCDVDADDLGYWRGEFGSGSSVVASIVVPEPTGLLWLLTGALFVCRNRTRRGLSQIN